MSDKKTPATRNREINADKFVEGVDYYFNDGLMILTGVFLLKRGYCCGNGCRHCPYSTDEKAQLQKKSI